MDGAAHAHIGLGLHLGDVADTLRVGGAVSSSRDRNIVAGQARNRGFRSGERQAGEIQPRLTRRGGIEMLHVDLGCEAAATSVVDCTKSPLLIAKSDRA